MNLTKEQEEAINYKDNKNVIVSAGAGSGKTSVLSERVLRILKYDTNIDELLILTFTNAAAFEMKNRIRNKIKENPDLKKQLAIIDSAYIGTFDSFASTIVKKYNYLLNVSKNFKIIDQNLLNYQKHVILDKLFNIEYENNNPKLLSIISSYCEKDDKNLKEFIINLDNKLNLMIDKEDYLEKYLDNNFKDDKINENINLFEKYVFSIIDDIKTNLDKFNQIASAKNIEKLNNYLNPLINVSTYDDLYKIDLPTFPTLTNLETELEYKKNIQELLKKLKELIRFKDKEEIKKSILSTYDLVSFIIDIEKKLNICVNKYKFNNDLFEFNDIAKLAIKVVKENDFVKEEIKSSFKEIMIDEYQDTSDLQEEFIKLIANNNVYMVGDIKQSIYKFRNANPDIFKCKYNDYKSNLNGHKIDLTYNFRSRSEVVNDINLIFNNLMTDTLGGVNYLEQQMIYGNKDYDKYSSSDNYNLDILNYQTEGIKYSNNMIEAFIIAKDIRNKIDSGFKVLSKDGLRNSTYSDFAIMIDRSQSFDMYKKVFDYFKIPIDVWTDEKVSDDIAFMLLKNILGLIIKIKEKEYDTEFKYLMTSILRSPLINATDQEIFNMYLHDDFINNDLYSKCFELSYYYDNNSIKELVLKIIDEFNFYDKLIEIGNVSSSLIRIDYFINSSEDFSNMGYSIKDFIDFLSEILDKDNDIKIGRIKGNGNTVKLMTIHTSKGLEYPVCYYASLFTNTNRRDKNDRYIFDSDLGIITPYDLDGIDQTIYKDLFNEKYIQEEMSERIRLFYVALTRAREKMILVTHDLEENHKKDMKSFEDFLATIYSKINTKIINVDLNELGLTRDYNKIKNSNYKDFINISNNKIDVKELDIKTNSIDNKSYSKDEVYLIDEDTSNNMHFGTYMHEVLELIDLKNPNYDNIDLFAKTKIENLLKQDLFKNIDKAKIYKEYEFMYTESNTINHGIIDLMLVYDNHIDIVDYKLKHIDDKAYQEQLNGYKKYIENKLNKNTNIYLYSIMDNKLNKL